MFGFVGRQLLNVENHCFFLMADEIDLAYPRRRQSRRLRLVDVSSFRNHRRRLRQSPTDNAEMERNEKVRSF